jgi:CTP:molybdopterin cytidylyltransferase MocA
VLRRGQLERAGELSGDAGFRHLLGGATEVECGHLCDPRDVDTVRDMALARRAAADSGIIAP